MSGSYVHYILSLLCVLKRFGAWEGAEYLVGQYVVWVGGERVSVAYEIPTKYNIEVSHW